MKLEEAPFAAGTVVLAKLKGFPAWPGMIVNEESLTPSILGAKPKGSSKSSKKSAIANQGPHYPVKFFVDNNFMWATKADLKLLSVDDANKYLETTKKKDRMLNSAYQMAANPPDLDTFVSPPEEPAEENAELDERPANGKTKAKTAKKQDKKESSAPKKEPKKKEDASTASKKRPNKELLASEKKRSKTEKSTASSIPSSKQLSRDNESRSKTVFLIRHKLQRGFLSKKPEEKDIPGLSEYLTQLENIDDLELSIIRQTKVNKVLKALLKIPDIPLESEYKLHERSMNLLQKWSTLPDDRAVGKSSRPLDDKEVSAQLEDYHSDRENKELNGLSTSAQKEEPDVMQGAEHENEGETKDEKENIVDTKDTVKDVEEQDKANGSEDGKDVKDIKQNGSHEKIDGDKGNENK